MRNSYRFVLHKFLYFLALIIYLIYQFWENTQFVVDYDLSTPRLLVFFIVFCLLSLKFVVDRKYNHIFIFLIMFILFSYVGARVSNIRELILTVFFIFESRNIEFKSILKIFLFVLSSFTFVVVLLSYVGVFDMNLSTSIRERNYLGFIWVSYGPNIFMTIALAWIYLYKPSKNNILIYFILFFINIFFFIETDTKAVFFELFFVLIIFLLVKYKCIKTPNNKITRILLCFSFILMFILTISLTLTYNRNSVGLMINNLLSNRLFYNFQALSRYDISLFGNVVGWNMMESDGIGYFYVDSSYIQILLQYGVIILTAVLLYFTYLMHIFLNDKNIFGVLCLFGIALHAITDPHLLLLMYNPFLLSLGYIANVKKNKRGIIEKY